MFHHITKYCCDIEEVAYNPKHEGSYDSLTPLTSSRYCIDSIYLCNAAKPTITGSLHLLRRGHCVGCISEKVHAWITMLLKLRPEHKLFLWLLLRPPPVQLYIHVSALCIWFIFCFATFSAGCHLLHLTQHLHRLMLFSPHKPKPAGLYFQFHDNTFQRYQIMSGRIFGKTYRVLVKKVSI